MTAAVRGAAAEIVLAFVAGAASFAVVAVILSTTEPDVVTVLLAGASIAVVVAVARAAGVAYATPIAIAGLVAYDWYEFPPVHPKEFPSSTDLAGLVAYLSVAVLVGSLGAHAGRRAQRSDAARSELAEEQAALRRVATLVAKGVPPAEVFVAVGREAGTLIGADGARVIRYLPGDEIDQLSGWLKEGYGPLPEGRMHFSGVSIASRIRASGEVARIDDYLRAAPEVPPPVRQLGIRSGVGAPIFVDGRLWGAMLAFLMHPMPLPRTAEARLAGFTELIATAISNSLRGEELARLAAEQAALRRVATLVARAVSPAEVFDAVAREIAQLLDVDAAHVARYDPDRTAFGVASWSRSGSTVPRDTRAPLDGNNVTSLVYATGRPARVDSYAGATGPIGGMLRELGLQSSVGAPIVVGGRAWGVMIASSKTEASLASDTEARLAAFAELVATAISNADARTETERLSEEQAALRRVATLVARDSPPEEIFTSVAEEMARLLHVEDMRMVRYDAGEMVTVVGSWGGVCAQLPAGVRTPLGGQNVSTIVHDTGRPGRIDDYDKAGGPVAELVRSSGVRSAVGAPIVVNGQIWGAMIAGTQQATPLPGSTESRLSQFTELIATSIANVLARADLAASRARLLEATDDERRRLVRDLHDGAQQRLVHTVITLKLAQRALVRAGEEVNDLVSEGIEQAERAMAELHELAHGILPSVLTREGLRAGVQSLASRMPVPVDVEIALGRLPAAVEATAYFVVAEALTNVAKHAGARSAEVGASVEEGTLQVRVRDDGVGGARADGSGLQGLADRLAVLDGRLAVESPEGGGTLVRAAIPIGG